MRPTGDQVETYRRDGFLVVERFLEDDEVERVREHFERAFAHDWETGLAPDEVNYQPGETPPDRTRQLCNVWKADRVLAATTLARRNAEFAAGLAAVEGFRMAHDNAIWKPPSGKSLLCHQDAAYCDWLDPPNMTTCWMLSTIRPLIPAPSTTCADRITGRARRSAAASMARTTGSGTSAR